MCILIFNKKDFIMKKKTKDAVEYFLIIILTVACTILAMNVFKQIVDTTKQNVILNDYKQKDLTNSEKTIVDNCKFK